MALSYILAIVINVNFSTFPNNLISLCFASGITLAMVFTYRLKALPGIIIGSLIEVVMLFHFNDRSLTADNNFWLLCFIYSSINCIQPLIASALIRKYSHHRNLFAHLGSIWTFIVAAFFSPLISALIGTTALYYVGMVEIEKYPVCFLGWWLANALSHLIITPLLLIKRRSSLSEIPATNGELILIGFSLYFINLFLFQFNYSVEYLLILVLIWSVFRLSQLYSCLIILFTAVITVICTRDGYGVFVQSNLNQSLIFVQSFLAILAITTLTLHAIVYEKQHTQLFLKNTLDNLEITVNKRTQQLKETQTHLEKVNKALEQMVNTDSLTKIANRRCFDERLFNEWLRLYRTQKHLSLLMIDVDFFKVYNDTYGHQLGDECLVQIAQALFHSCLRTYDLVARYGGEEFAVLLPHTDLQGAIVVAQRIQENIENLNIPHENSSITSHVTVSIGISSLIPLMNESPQILVHQADKALYLSKDKGRNQYQTYVAKNIRNIRSMENR